MTKHVRSQLNILFEEFKKENLVLYYYLLILNLVVIVFQFIYSLIRYPYLNEVIPLWYTKPWGDLQLTGRENLFAMPIVSLLIFLSGFVLIVAMRKLLIRYLYEVVILIVSFANLALTYSLLRVVSISSSPFPSLVDPIYFQFIPPFLIGFILVFFLTPKFIEFAREKGMVTHPNVHSHPAMILTKPTVRGGGIVYTAAFLITAMIFVPFSLPVMGIFLVSALLALFGFFDDYQNTHPNSYLKVLETPLLRLFLLFVLVSVVILFNIEIGAVGSPLGGVINLTGYNLVSSLLTIIWVVWILNLLSWSNGIDGQYSGIIGIASLFIAFLALRFSPLLPSHISYATLAVISAGCSFGLAKYTWFPSKVMWGFSAISAGLVLSSLSILISSKITISIMIMLIPFLDAVVTVVRRLLQRKNPLKGDKGHLHHLLMERGWSASKIAGFYWITSAVFGLVGVIASEQYLLQVTLIVAGIVAFFIVLLNLQTVGQRQALPQTE
jgi:UDP-GlcNAc:undecaprenyl-phosphate/decaprenyl-phosphate GlcNAc-1-phosphate transferase